MLKRKVEIVDNSEIEAFYEKCRTLVSEWNASRGKKGGEIEILIETSRRSSGKKAVKLNANPPETRGSNITMLQIEYDDEISKFVAYTPGLPFQKREIVDLERIRRTLKNFNP